MEYIIETNALTKRYGDKAAVSGVSLRVKKGEIYGLVGKNGAGKTTLMRLLLGLAAPNQGEMKLFGSTDLNGARRKIGALIEDPAIYKNETALGNLKRFAILVPTPEEQLHRILEMVGLSDTGNKKAGEFSLGMRQRLGIAIALLGDPQLLILDEPINGLDPAGMKEMRDLFVELNKQGVTILISSHLLDELGKIATRYGLMDDGVLVDEFTPAEVVERSRVSLRITVNDATLAAEVLTRYHAEAQIQIDGNMIRVLSAVEDNSLFVEELVKNQVRVYEVITESKGVESFFIERLGG